MIPSTSQTGCVEVRNASQGDLGSVLALLGRSGLPTQGVTAEAMDEFMIAESQGKLIGVAGLEVYRDSALLRSAAVEETWRGTGVGRVLIDRALDRSRELGIHDVFLLTTSAEHYFPKFGFVCVSGDSVPDSIQQSCEFRGPCPATATVMRKTIGG